MPSVSDASALAAVAAVATLSCAVLHEPANGLHRLGLHGRAPSESERRSMLTVSAAVVLLTSAVLWHIGVSERLAVGSAVALALAGVASRVAIGVRRRGEARRGAAFVLELATAFSAELRAGRLPAQALWSAVSSLEPADSDVSRALASLTPSATPDVLNAALAKAQQCPGGYGLARLRLCWQVSDASGTGLAEGVDRAAASLRSQRAIHLDIASETASAHATGRLLALLPVATLGGGMALGIDPLGVLLRTDWGRGCLVAGLALAGLGQWWVAQIARRAMSGFDESRRWRAP